MTKSTPPPGSEESGRIGAYPGSFNPPTIAHLAIAEAAASQHRLDRVDLIVSRHALAKDPVAFPRFEHRIEVLEAEAAQRAWLGVKVSDDQLIADLAAGYDVIVLGADKWQQIQQERWYPSAEARDEAMARLPTVAIAPREDLPTPPELTLDLDGYRSVSSTEARRGRLELMSQAAAEFAKRSGAWVDRAAYDRFVAGGSS